MAQSKLSNMLFMVVETFRHGPSPVRQRFIEKGRMLGVSTFLSSWMDSTGERCFQLMEADSEAGLAEWIKEWDDLVDFEVVPVEPSPDFWARYDASLT